MEPLSKTRGYASKYLPAPASSKPWRTTGITSTPSVQLQTVSSSPQSESNWPVIRSHRSADPATLSPSSKSTILLRCQFWAASSHHKERLSCSYMMNRNLSLQLLKYTIRSQVGSAVRSKWNPSSTNGTHMKEKPNGISFCEQRVTSESMGTQFTRLRRQWTCHTIGPSTIRNCISEMGHTPWIWATCTRQVLVRSFSNSTRSDAQMFREV